METFSSSLAICVENAPVTGEFPTQRPVKLSFGVFFDLRLNKWLGKQSWGWWFEAPPLPLWRHCNEETHYPCPYDGWALLGDLKWTVSSQIYNILNMLVCFVFVFVVNASYFRFDDHYRIMFGP